MSPVQPSIPIHSDILNSDVSEGPLQRPRHPICCQWLIRKGARRIRHIPRHTLRSASVGITMLKALFNESFCDSRTPVVASDNGLSLVPYTGTP